LPPWDERVFEGVANVSQPAPGIGLRFGVDGQGPSWRESGGGNNVECRDSPKAHTTNFPISGKNVERAV
jgi:hypothetical protein